MNESPSTPTPSSTGEGFAAFLDALLHTRTGHGLLALVLGVCTTLITWGLASAFTQVDGIPATTVDITLYIVAGGVWTFLLLWAIRPR